MNVSVAKYLRATTLAGFLPFFLTLLLWPIVSFLIRYDLGSIDYGSFSFGLFVVAIFSLFVGITLNIVIGMPTLIILEKMNLNNPLLVAAIGGVIGVLLFHFFGPNFLKEDYRAYSVLLAFFAIQGSSLAGFSNYLLRRNSGA